MSFTAATKVLLASGKAVPIFSLKPGEKMLATSTRTGRTRAEAISVVMVHHDTNLYDLTLHAHGRTAVIHTTSNHPFWDATTGRWVKAAALRYGTHLRTPSGGTATVLGGHAPGTGPAGCGTSPSPATTTSTSPLPQRTSSSTTAAILSPCHALGPMRTGMDSQGQGGRSRSISSGRDRHSLRQLP